MIRLSGILSSTIQSLTFNRQSPKNNRPSRNLFQSPQVPLRVTETIAGVGCHHGRQMPLHVSGPIAGVRCHRGILPGNAEIKPNPGPGRQTLPHKKNTKFPSPFRDPFLPGIIGDKHKIKFDFLKKMFEKFASPFPFCTFEPIESNVQKF